MVGGWKNISLMSIQIRQTSMNPCINEVGDASRGARHLSFFYLPFLGLEHQPPHPLALASLVKFHRIARVFRMDRADLKV